MSRAGSNEPAQSRQADLPVEDSASDSSRLLTSESKLVEEGEEADEEAEDEVAEVAE